MEKDHRTFMPLLKEAEKFHGHLCAGQLIGVRMAMLGLRELGIADPRGRDKKRLIVYVEIDRCATDAIMTVTGCRVGKRNMKVMDYGKMAATFIDLATERAVRIVSLPEARQTAAAMYPDLDEGQAQMKAYPEMDDGALFSVQDVTVFLRPEDLPGRPLGQEKCAVCGETVLDCRELREDELVRCRPCATNNRYYSGRALPRQPLEKRAVV